MNQRSRRKLMKMLALQSQSSDMSDRLANLLINDLEIQNGIGLAGFLEVDKNFDNFTAVRVWTGRKCKQKPQGDMASAYETLKNDFRKLLPPPQY